MSERLNVRSETEQGRFVSVPPPGVFSEKRLQTVENKGSGREKERKERSRVSKLLKYGWLEVELGEG
jgi:hypothetical protein